MTPSVTHRYRQIADELRANIVSGHYAINSLLPTELELCALYDVSRHTARGALRVLMDDGMVERRQGHGTRVVANAPHAFQRSISSVSDLLQYGANTHLSIVSSTRMVATPAIAKYLGCAVGAPCVHLHGLRSERGAKTPFCVTDIYRLAGRDALTKRLANARGAVYAIIDELAIDNVARVEQHIGAHIASAETAKALGCQSKEPCLSIVRRYHDSDEALILVAVSQYRAADYVYSMELKRNA
jgi:GntR family transcriptional regulator